MLTRILATIAVLALFTSAQTAHASDVEKCRYGTAALHHQSESAIEGALRQKLDDADRAKASNDMPACMKALQAAMPMTPVTAENFMGCTGGLTALRAASVTPSIESQISHHLNDAETSATAGDMKACLASVQAAMDAMPELKSAMNGCTSGRAHLQTVSSVSEAIQHAMETSGGQLLDGDLKACNATVSTAMKKM